MSNLFSALHSSASALDVLNRSIDVVQNNVANANTPGYASQTQVVEALPFDPAGGLSGGVKAGALQSSRDQFAEQAVWRQQEGLGLETGKLDGLTALQQLFDVSGNSGIPSALNQLFASFSNWSNQPGDTTARQQVISAARSAAQTFNQVATGIARVSAGVEQQIGDTVTQVNQLAAAIRDINVQRQHESGPDAGLDAQLHADLEQLSQLADINVLYQDDGTVTVLTGSGSPLVIGQTADQLSASVTNGGVQIFDSNQQDIAPTFSGGKLAGLLQLRNEAVPGLVTNVNTLAQNLADSVNSILTAGTTSTTPPSSPGVPLFTYASAATAAASIAVDPSVTPAALAPATAGPPAVANGTAANLAGLGQQGMASLGGMNLMDFYSQIASDVGRQQAAASDGQQTGQQLVAQAQQMRTQISGVSLNEQAAALMQFQQSYQAISKVVSVISTLTDSLINMVQQ